MSLDDFVEDAMSDEVEVDFSGAVDFEPLEGEFPFIVTAAERGTVKSGENAGATKITLKLRVTDGEKANRVVQKDLPMQGKGAGITKQFLKAAEYDGHEDVIEGREKISLQKLVGLQFNAVCTKGKPPYEDFTRVGKAKAFDPEVVNGDDSL